MDMMMAVRAHTRGGPEQLVYEQAPVPVPQPGEALVTVHAAAITFAELTWDLSWTTADGRDRTPVIPSHEMSGTVAALGAGTSGVAPGDEVYGLIAFDRDGAAAEYVSMPATELTARPRSVSHQAAAALPLAALTAWQALVDHAALQAGERVLVHGGAGGVGHVAVQLALARGATVFATGTGASLDTIGRLGAEPIDYRTTSVEDYVASATGGEGFDVIFDAVGGATLDASFAAVRTYTGHVVSILGWGTHSLAPLSFRGATYSGVFTLLPLLTGRGRAHHGEILAEAAALAEAGRLTPIVDPDRYDLETVSDAHRAVESGKRQGKVVVRVSPA